MSEVNFELQEIADSYTQAVVDVQYDDLVTEMFLQMCDQFDELYSEI
jgi:hypothetical protein